MTALKKAAILKGKRGLASAGERGGRRRVLERGRREKDGRGDLQQKSIGELPATDVPPTLSTYKLSGLISDSGPARKIFGALAGPCPPMSAPRLSRALYKTSISRYIVPTSYGGLLRLAYLLCNALVASATSTMLQDTVQQHERNVIGSIPVGTHACTRRRGGRRDLKATHLLNGHHV